MTATVSTNGPGAGTNRIPHVVALDGLRGAAVAAVLLHHGGHLTGGWLGVDLFFVLSGYLITALLLAGWSRDGRVALAGFWSRRARRLGPALVVTLVAAGIYAATVALPTEQLGIRWDGLATLGEVANWRTIVTGGDYWAVGLRPSPLRHTWSLSIEEQLYLLWPLVLATALVRWRSPRAVLATASALAVASVAAMVLLSVRGADPSRLYYGTDTRAAAVLVGAALAAGRMVLGPQRWIATRRGRQVAGALGAAYLAVAWVTLDGSDTLPYRGLLPVASVAAAAVVASVADRRHPGVLGRALELRPLVLLGVISYGVYLYHWPIYLVADEARTGLGGWPLTAVRIALTIAAAAISYRYLEEPVRSGRMFAGHRGRAALVGGAALSVLALVGGTLGARANPPADTSGRIERSAVAGAPTVLLAGDSVPLLLGVELTEQVDELGVSLVNRSAPGCHLLAGLGPIRGVEGNVRSDVADCSDGGRYRTDVERFDPDVSVVLFGEFPNQAVELDGRWTMPCDERYLQALRTRLDSLVDDLRATGAPVVLVSAPGTSLSWVLEQVEPGMAARVDCTNAILDDVARARTGVHVVDLATYICPEPDRCRTEVDGADLREDGLHFRDAGAASVNRWLVPRALEAAGLTDG